MTIRAVSHIAVGVRDMDRSLEFYRDLLGMSVSLDAVEEFPGRTGAAPTRRRGVYLRWRAGDDASFIVLDEQISSEPFGAPPRLFQVGTHHFGLWVDDLDAMVARAEASGFTPAIPAVDADSEAYGETPGGKVRTVFLRDPDGNFVQLDQRLS